MSTQRFARGAVLLASTAVAALVVGALAASAWSGSTSTGPATTATVSYPCDSLTGAASKIFDNGNVGAVQNGATAPTTFTTTKSWRVIEVCTYHWNNGSGTTAPGKIGLKNLKTGKQYGPWQATGKPGMGGVPNAYWLVKVSVVIPTGSYSIVDSDPSTWSQNSESGGHGMAFVIATTDPKAATLSYTCGTVTGKATKIFDNGNVGAVQNGATASTTFKTTKRWRVVEICTYHWNNGSGMTAPGKIGLKNLKTGKRYGPWKATGKPGMGGVPNAYWLAKVNVVLPKGGYRIVDSDVHTWSQNSGTHGRGMAFVIARPVAAKH
jgi:hypothetical protein